MECPESSNNKLGHGRDYSAYLTMRGTPINRSIWTCHRSERSVVILRQQHEVYERLEILRMGIGNLRMFTGNGTVPERVQLHAVHTNRDNRTRSITVPLRS